MTPLRRRVIGVFSAGHCLPLSRQAGPEKVGAGLAYPGRRYAAAPLRLPWAKICNPYGVWQGRLDALAPAQPLIVCAAANRTTTEPELHA